MKTRPNRILRSADFRKVYDQGTRISGPLFNAFCLVRAEEPGASEPPIGPRLGLTVPRAVGGAVERNRIKRRMRGAFRAQREKLGAEWDIVINPRRAVLTAAFPEIERALRKVIERCRKA